MLYPPDRNPRAEATAPDLIGEVQASVVKFRAQHPRGPEMCIGDHRPWSGRLAGQGCLLRKGNSGAATEEKVELFGDPVWTTLCPLGLGRVCRGKSAIPECVRSPGKSEWVGFELVCLT